MGGDDHAAPPDPTHPDGHGESPFYRWAKSVFALTPWGLQRRLENQRADLQKAEERIGHAIQTIQSELASLSERLEKRADTAESAIRDVSGEIGRLRDEVFPASMARSDALLQRLAEELEEVASLSER